MELRTSGRHRAMRWANGAGTTYEITARPTPEDWIWRLSLAMVQEDGAFSELPGVDRALVVATGNGMTLRVGDATHDLARYDLLEFSGDETTTAELVDGPVRDLNLMVRRGRGIGRPRLRVERFAAGATVTIDDARVIVVLDGVLTITTPTVSFPFNPEQERAARHDALIVESADHLSPPTISVTRDAVVAFASFHPLG